jgi:hypothetical protein
MQVGVIIPQGWKYEYNGWDPAAAWARTLELARDAEALGFESEWVFDHFHTVPDVLDEITFESFTTLTAMAGVTSRVRLGHMVVCNGFRNPALVAKLASTLDVAAPAGSNSGSAAGWKEDEWLAYGYGFPSTHDRLGGAARQPRSDHPNARPGHGPRTTAGTPESSTRSTFRRESSSRGRRSSSAATARTSPGASPPSSPTN